MKLMPLGHDEAENHRVIKMTHDKKEIEVGRASKNPQKGLLAKFDNAWFDYPILSRTHAKFTASPSQRLLYVKDCGSTHGTFLSRSRMTPWVEYTVSDGAIITFGQRVTSGAMTYPAKDFRVHSMWESRIPASVRYSGNQASPNSFQVPDHHNDSCSDFSREGSVQILESCPRTFSVPSPYGESESEDSDVESVEIASSVLGEGGKSSAATTPDHGATAKLSMKPTFIDLEESSDNHLAQSKVRGLNLKGPSLVDVLAKPVPTGASQQNPIDLEGGDVPKKVTCDTESDDEGPEVLPIPQPSSRSGKSPVRDEPELVSGQHAPGNPANILSDLETEHQVDPVHHPLSTLDERKHNSDIEERFKSAIQNTQAYFSKGKEKEHVRDQSPEIPHATVIGATDGFYSTDEEELDNDDLFSDFDREEETVDSFSKLMTYGPNKVYPVIPEPAPTSTIDYSYAKMQEQPHLKPNACNVSTSDNIHVSQPTWTERFPAPTQRAPSPSDAALARNPSELSVCPGVYDTYRPVRPIRYTPPGYYRRPTGHHMDTPFGYQYQLLQDVGNPNTHARPYDQGPFTNPAQATSTWPFFGDEGLGRDSDSNLAQENVAANYVSNYAAMNSDSCIEGPNQPDIEADAQYAAELQAEEDAYAIANEASVETSQPTNLGSEMRKSSDGQSSKINIASLVNASQVEDSRLLKRKADDMSTDSEAIEASGTHDMTTPTQFQQSVSTEQAQSHPHSSHGVAETQLPDAQAREMVPQIDQLSLSQDSVSKDASHSMPIPSVTKATEAEGPPRKKAKTSSSSAGMGKFVSGVCVGLVGAFAAFVATIPASVREEALRELASAS